MTINKNQEENTPPASGHLVHPKYRPDIDGLRAVAVLSVVVYHAFPSLLKGGFVGVDIFFVISGFLISTIIFSSLERDSFSFYDFYSRRIRRIFPALLVVLISCYVFGWFALLADEYKQLGKHIAAGAGFVSNLVLWSESGYFDAAAETKPLLHLWSLGIEEQFYIVWPVLLWAAWKKKFNLFTISIVLFFISFGLNLSKYRVDGVADFYSPQTRFWELLAGSLLAYVTHHNFQVLGRIKGRLDSWLGKVVYAHPPEVKGQTFRDAQSLFGALLIALGLVLITKEKHFPGTWAILPVLGAVCTISAGSNSWFNRIFLSNRLMVWFGIISFPLYLWHWPLLSFARIIEGEVPARSIRIAAVLLSITLAWLTYKLVERPLRFGGRDKLKVSFLVFIMALLGYVGYNTYQRDGLQFRLNEYQLRKIHQLPTKMQISNYENSALFKSAWQNVQPIKSRDFLLSSNENGKKGRIAIIGDSHANRLYLGLESESQLSVLNIGRGTCPPFLDVDVLDKSNNSVLCQPLVNNYLRFVRDSKDIRIVILNAFYIQYNRDASLSADGGNIQTPDAIARTVEYLASSGKTVVVALDVPEVPAACYQKSNVRNFPVWRSENNKHCFINKIILDSVREEILKAISRIKSKPGNVFVFDPADVLCKNDICGEIDMNNYLYHTDGNHLNELGIRVVGRWLLEELRKIPDIKINK